MKRYPFSVQKHAHSIEFRYNRVKNTLDKYYMGGAGFDQGAS